MKIRDIQTKIVNVSKNNIIEKSGLIEGKRK